MAESHREHGEQGMARPRRLRAEMASARDGSQKPRCRKHPNRKMTRQGALAGRRRMDCVRVRARREPSSLFPFEPTGLVQDSPKGLG
jgi:hypothetical protein